MGLYFRNLRQKKGLTQKELAESLGYSIQLVSAWEHGKSFPDCACWKPLCDLYRVSLFSLLNETGEPEKDYQEHDFSIEGFATRIKSARKKRGFTQAELSTALSLNPKTIMSFESGKSLPSKAVFLKLAEYFQMSEDELYYGYVKEAEPAPAIVEEEAPAPIKKPIPIFVKIGVPALLLAAIAAISIVIPLSLNAKSPQNPAISSSSGVSLESSSVQIEDLYVEEEANRPADMATVHCLKDDGTELGEVSLRKGKRLADIEFNPLPYVEGEYAYVFSGWNVEEMRIYEDCSVYATFAPFPLSDYESCPFEVRLIEHGVDVELLRYKTQLKTDTLTLPSHFGSQPITKVSMRLGQFDEVRRIVIPDTVKTIVGPLIKSNEYVEEILIGNGIECIDGTLGLDCPNLRYNEYGSERYLGNQANPYLVYCGGIEYGRTISLHDSCLIMNQDWEQQGDGFETMRIGPNLRYISRGLESQVGHFLHFDIDSANAYFAFKENCLIDLKRDTLIACCYGTSSIPEVSYIRSEGLFNHTHPNVILPETLIELEDDAFGENYEVQSIDVGENLAYFGRQSYRSPRLGRIEVSSTNPVYRSYDGALYSRDYRTLYLLPPAKSGSSVSFLPNLASIAPFAISECKGINEFILGGEDSNLHELKAESVVRCANLTKVSFGTSVRVIQRDAFYECASLKEVTFSKSITKICASAFNGCLNLKDVYYEGSEEAWSKVEKEPDELWDKVIVHCLG